MDSPKNEIIDKLNQATNVLVTVSASPSVDQLAAAIGLTLFLNKLGKHATAVFSGKTPSTIEFLQPEKTLEKNTDSLRDFIIALDKSKADKLRYKVEDQMVKIFITPYRTSISDKDLEFSQGDFNVDVVVALGIDKQQDLDQAISSHGRILHDATVISINTHEAEGLGTINWVQADVSGLSEVLIDLALTMKADMLDAQMATAFLTGIVAETNRFSNEKTSSQTMQLSAKLMTAGANQQLIASQLQSPTAPTAVAEDAELPEIVAGGEAHESTEPHAKPDADGSLRIEHGTLKPLTDAANEITEEEPEPEPEVEQIHIDTDGMLKLADDSAPATPKTVEPLVDQSETSPHIMLQPPTLGSSPTPDEGAGLSDSFLGPAPTAGPSPLAAEETNVNPLEASAPTGQSANGYIIGDTPAPTTGPIEPPVTMTHEQPIVEPESEKPETTLSDLEQSIASPHIEETVPAPEPAPSDHIDAARNAVLDAVEAVPPQIIEPAQALPPLPPPPADLNLGDMPAVTTSPASAFTDSATMVDPSTGSLASSPADDSNVTSDPGLPPGLVPPDPGLPLDNTATSVTDPTAPPPVPPPMMPPSMPPSGDPSDPNNPNNTAL